MTAPKPITHTEPLGAIARCEALINEARRGNAMHIEREARRWRAEAQVAGHTAELVLASHALASSLLMQSRGAEAIPIFVEVAQGARDAGDLDRYVRALVQSARALADMGAHHRALELLSDAGKLADDSVSERARYILHAVQADIAYWVRDYVQALAYAA